RPGTRPVDAAGRSAAPPRRVRELARFGDEDPVADARIRLKELLEQLSGKHEATQRMDRDDVGDRRFAEEHRDLAEEVAATERVHAGRAGDDDRLALQDDVEG